LVAPTAADARDVMVEGESGILAISPPWCRPEYEPSKRRVTWPNGAIATTYSADEPDRLRGPQHDLAWCDEIAVWRYPDAWDMLQLGLRLGSNPRTLATTTPRPVKLVRDLISSPLTAVIRGATFDNKANLPTAFLQQITAKYRGTRLGRQELLAEILDDVPGALWTLAGLDATRLETRPAELSHIVVGIDPSGGKEDGNDEQGIIGGGVDEQGDFYVLADRSCKLSPDGWARRAIELYLELQADAIVYEKNFGGDMVEHTLTTVADSMGVRDRVVLRAVTASRGKRVRAEPIAALWEQKRGHIVGSLPELEDEMRSTDWNDRSPNRADAMVWVGTQLVLGEKPPSYDGIAHVVVPRTSSRGYPVERFGSRWR
jgi:phage terminase large subunit-like protein